MAGDDDTESIDVTDSIPIPRATPIANAPIVRITAGGSEREGPMLSVQGDEIAVIVEQGWPVDTQVELSTGSVSSIGVVIWSRADDGKVALGVEIVGGAAEWKDLL